MKKLSLPLLFMFIFALYFFFDNMYTQNQLKGYQLASLYATNDLSNAYAHIVNVEVWIVGTPDPKERETLLANHEALVENLQWQRNTVDGILAQDDKLYERYKGNDIDENIHQAMVNFGKATTEKDFRDRLEEVQVQLEAYYHFMATIEPIAGVEV